MTTQIPTEYARTEDASPLTRKGVESGGHVVTAHGDDETVNVRRDPAKTGATPRVPVAARGGGDDAASLVYCPYCRHDVIGSTEHLYGLCIRKGGRR